MLWEFSTGTHKRARGIKEIEGKRRGVCSWTLQRGEVGGSKPWALTGSHTDTRLSLAVWLELRMLSEYRESLLAGWGG